MWTLRDNVAQTGLLAKPAQSPVDSIRTGVVEEVATGAPALRAMAEQLRNGAVAKPDSVGSVKSAQVSRPATASTLVNESAVSKEATGPEERAESSKPGVKPSPEFLFCFMDYIPAQGNGVTLVFSLPYEAHSLPVEIRRFGDDVALGLFGQPIQPRVGELRWPMVKSMHIAQTELEARAVVIDRASRCQPDLIAFGDLAQNYLVGEAPPPGGRRVYPAGGYQDYCSIDKAAGASMDIRKSELWQLLKEVQTGL